MAEAWRARLAPLVRQLRASRAGAQDVVVLTGFGSAGMVIRLVSSILMARGLGPEGLGIYPLAMTGPDATLALSNLGLAQTAVRYASRAAAEGDRERHARVLAWAFRLRLALMLAASLAAALAAPWVAATLWRDASLQPLVYLSLLISILGLVGSFPTAYFESLKRFALTGIARQFVAADMFISVVALAVAGLLTVYNLVLGRIALGCATVLVAWMLIPAADRARLLGLMARGSRKADWAPALAPSGERGALTVEEPGRFARYMTLATVVGLVMVRVDVWLMGLLIPKAEIGLYAAATRFALPLIVALNALNTALWPRASACHTRRETAALLKRATALAGALALAGVAYALVAPLVMPFLLGRAFGESVGLARVLSLRYCFALLGCPIGIIGYNYGLVRYGWLLNVGQLGLIVLMGVTLLPTWGPMACALALLLADVLGTAAVVLFVWQRHALSAKVDE
ncbi:MAG: oligosaccharide flippase family protein [Chloroflexota bacterium]